MSRLLHGIAVLVAAVALARVGRAQESASATPLLRAHAHNDYWHERPLLDALDHGFCSVEADVFLVDGQLLVGHARNELDPQKTLAALYLEPLRKRVKANGGHVFPGVDRFFLLVDVKSDAEETYRALHDLLGEYRDVLTSAEAGEMHPGAVTIVVSGNRAEATIRNQKTRFVGIDGRPSDLDRAEPAHVMPWISENWNNQFRWKGDGPMPADQRRKLRDYVAKAHEHGRLVRFWATPENEAVWRELLAADVDLTGTDQLEKLQRFLTVEGRRTPSSN
jgi:hypothetical protein